MAELSTSRVFGDLTVSGLTKVSVLQSLIGTGTAPLVIASTTLVNNLNADLLDGLHGSVAATLKTYVARGASLANIQVTGRSSAWGSTNGAMTGGVNVLTGNSTNSTWLISGTSNGAYKGGLQLLDSGSEIRLYALTGWLDLNSAGVVTASGGFSGALTGNASTATVLQTARTIAISGDGTGTATSFNGSVDITIPFTLSNTGVTAGTYKSVTVDTKGRVTSGTNPTTLGGYGITDAVLSTNRSNWNSASVICNVIGQLAWKNFGNGHTIFDASAGTSPDGTAVNNTNAAVVWSGTYPNLMGWNGVSTYGVRVDSARNADYLSDLLLNTSGRADVPNQIVRTDDNGYIQAGWINTTSGDNGTTAIGRIYASSDGYLRYYTPANFISLLDLIKGDDARLTNARVASDVYAWAKASVKPSYAFSEISSKPTTLAGYGITDALRSTDGTIDGTINGDLSVTGNGTFGGSLAVTGDVTFDLSDTRLKTEFEPIETALEKIKKLDVGTYYYNDLAREFGFTKTDRQVGLKAQQVQTVLPEAVALAPFDRGIDGSSKSGEEYLTVRYEKLVPLLVAAVKEQASEIEKLKNELEVVKHG